MTKQVLGDLGPIQRLSDRLGEMLERAKSGMYRVRSEEVTMPEQVTREDAKLGEFDGDFADEWTTDVGFTRRGDGGGPAGAE